MRVLGEQRSAAAASLALVLVLALTSRAAADAPPPPVADDRSPAAILFGRTCGSCHSLGEGARAGPDLLGVLQRRDRAWLAAIIRSPAALLARGDQTLRELADGFGGVVMPDQPISDEDLASTFAYLERCTAARGCRLVAGRVRPASDAQPFEIETGRKLVVGTVRLSAGGPPCIGCHSARGLAGGGTLGPDLTFAFARLFDERLSHAVDSHRGATMDRVYAKRPLTVAESFAVRSWIADLSRDGARPESDPALPLLGASGALLGGGAVALAWARLGRRR